MTGTEPHLTHGRLNAKVPIPTVAEQRALQLEKVKNDARHWTMLRDVRASTVEDHKGLIESAAHTVPKAKPTWCRLPTTSNPPRTGSIASKRARR